MANLILWKFYNDSCNCFPNCCNGNKSTQRAQTSANAKIWNKSDPPFDSEFSVSIRIRMSVYLSENIVDALPCRRQSFREYGTNQRLTVWEMLTNVQQSPISQWWKKNEKIIRIRTQIRIIIIIIIINDSIYPAVSKASRTGNKVSCQPNDCPNRRVFKRRLKMASDGAETKSAGRSFQIDARCNSAEGAVADRS